MSGTPGLPLKLANRVSWSTATTSGSENCSDLEDEVPLVRSQTVSSMSDARLNQDYPPELVEKNCFLEIPYRWIDPSELRSTRSEPCTPRSRSQSEVDSAVLSTWRGREGGQWARQLNYLTCGPVRLFSDKPVQPLLPSTESVPVLHLTDFVLSPQVGTSEVPTVGSIGHAEGRCKPCAFRWKGLGCSNGANCSFCHLCGQDEKKRRQKEKKFTIRAQHQWVSTPTQQQTQNMEWGR